MDRNALPEVEREVARSIEHNLMSLQNIAEEFRQSAHLYLFAHNRKALFMARLRGGAQNTVDDNREMLGLIKIAGRNGAVVAASFFEITQAINATQKLAPTVWSKANKSERDKGSKLFAKEFPQVSHIRHSAAHPGELMSSETEAQKHRLKGSLATQAIQSGGGTYIEAMMNAFPEALDFGATFKGDFVKYQLSLAKADALDAVAKHYCQTFYPLERAGAGQQRARMRESDALRQLGQMSRLPWWHNLLRL